MSKRTKTPEYASWRAAQQRCFNPDHDAYQWYGARGIGMCERWLDSFDAFLEDMGPRPARTTLDRIDTDGDYEPSNCRWTSLSQQMRNRRSNIIVEYHGTEYVLKDLAAELGISYKALHRVYRYGKKTIEEAVADCLAIKQDGSVKAVIVEFEGKRWRLKDLARHLAVPYSILHYHFRRQGLSLTEGVERARNSKAVR